ncbi:unnamed protein product [Sphagnum troendelagicum]|uniref:Cytochrome P450 n=1 Tax=Sphagnum troendelagicum TaxID=128251 RepID=A0ABP0UHG9_9BRYO
MKLFFGRLFFSLVLTYFLIKMVVNFCDFNDLNMSLSLRLPLGSMGWPFFGETFALRSQQQKFYMIRQRTYGELFKTHVFGYPSIVTTSPEAAKFVLVEHPHLFRRRGLPFVEDALGYRFFGYIENHRLHMKLRKQLQVPLFHLHKLIPQLEAWAISLMRSWEGRTVNALQEAKLYAFNVATLFVLGQQSENDRKELTKACECIIKGLGCWRLYFPGTNYFKACQGRYKACELVDKIVNRRRQARTTQHVDILGILMDAEDDDKIPMSNRELRENVLTLLFAAHDATGAALTWTLKNLRENASLLDELTDEHDKIVQRKQVPDQPLTWTDIKDMLITQRVIKETLRIANVVDFSYREALEDIAYNGYLIPKGWRVMVVHTTFHLDAQNYPSPNKFDHNRFEVAPKPFTYTPFGNGAHVCLGRELAQLEMFIFLHHFTTKYR